MKRGFTLIELMVASLLLGMLVMIMTMIFNQSSIAWRTGTSSVRNLNDSRMALSAFHDNRDEVLPGLGDSDVAGGSSDNRTIRYRTVSLWNPQQDNQLRTTRAFNDDKGLVWNGASPITMSDAMKGGDVNVIGAGQAMGSKGGFSVGVRSLGPDGKPDTEDDINTWPEEID